MVSREPEQRVRLPLVWSGWLRQTFVHWAYPPDAVQALLPRGLTVDTHGGAAWVGLTPFLMSVPPLAAFPETNLRTYVRRSGGVDGLWFFTLEAANPLTAAARTAIGAPYHVGRLGITARGGTVTYTGAGLAGGAGYRLTVRPGGPAGPSEHAVWLTGRWRAFTERLGVLVETPVEHEPWPLASCAVEHLSETVTAAAGLPPPRGEPVAHYSEGVRRVRLGLPHPVRRGAAPGKGRTAT
ncbi:YqjF family protein [Streptomyces capparidis]